MFGLLRQEDKPSTSVTQGSSHAGSKWLSICLDQSKVFRDLASRFPDAKRVALTKADNVIPAICDNYGNPESHVCDRSPSLSSSELKSFANKRNIGLQKTPLNHPSSNPVETYMKLVRKNRTLAQLPGNNFSTPRPDIRIALSAMVSRNGQSVLLPRVSATEEEVAPARASDTCSN